VHRGGYRSSRADTGEGRGERDGTLTVPAAIAAGTGAYGNLASGWPRAGGRRPANSASGAACTLDGKDQPPVRDQDS
jgi:hypothetical protein